MASESSVAPKERVNIRYKPAIGNAKEEVELPLKLLMVGDYTLKADDRPIDERALVSIDKDTFDEVLKGYALNLALSVDSKLDEAATDEKMAVSLKFERMRDFEPEQVVRQIPELKRLLELRDALLALKGPLGNVPAFRKAIQGVLEDETSRTQLVSELLGDKPATE
jgi:type VI secretion system protein ImpB